MGGLAQPFGLSVQRVVDTGAPFEVVAFDTSSRAIDVIEQQSRQRGILVTSDGLGGILLTRPGRLRADEDLIYPGGNVQKMEARVTQRFSDHIVKAQGQPRHRGTQAPLSTDIVAGAAARITGMGAHEERAACQFGYCRDAGVGRYRPRVYLARTDSAQAPQVSRSGDDLAALLASSRRVHRAGRSRTQPPAGTETAARQDGQPYSLDDQAAWRMRTSRAGATAYVYTVPRLATVAGTLWRPNQIIHVRDDVNGVSGDMLIGGVTLSVTGRRASTRISVVAPDAYDLTGTADTTPRHGQAVRRHGMVRRRS